MRTLENEIDGQRTFACQTMKQAPLIARTIHHWLSEQVREKCKPRFVCISHLPFCSDYTTLLPSSPSRIQSISLVYEYDRVVICYDLCQVARPCWFHYDDPEFFDSLLSSINTLIDEFAK